MCPFPVSCLCQPVITVQAPPVQQQEDGQDKPEEWGLVTHKCYKVKAVPINDFILTMDQMCNVSCVACSDKPTENYHQLSSCPLLHAALQSLLAHSFGFHSQT